MEEELEKIKKIREIPKEVKKEIDNKVYENIVIATIIMASCVLMLLGYKNIEPMRYIIDLKTFSIIGLLGTIFIIERAYKKDSSKLAINAIETIVIALTMLTMPYVYTYYIYKFPSIIVFISSVMGTYYALKGIVVIFIERKKYRKSANDIKDITQ